MIVALLLPAPPAAQGQVLISEIMYHPSSDLDVEEYIEIHNAGAAPVNLAGWVLRDAVRFDFPATATLAAGGYLVVAADRAVFRAKYPAVTNMVGGWEQTLSNRSEEIELRDSLGVVVDVVDYADDGDWAVRELGPNDLGHRGWIWNDAHDGGGRSLELINPALPNDYGKNWAASLVDQGTPGAANSVAAANIAPLIVEVDRQPIIPGSTEPVDVVARLIDENAGGLSAALYYRVDGAPAFTAVVMWDDGLSGDGLAGDGVFGGQIPPHPNGTIIEYFLWASDGTTPRTYPALALVDAALVQATNMLYLVNDGEIPRETALARGSSWRYLDDGSDQGTAWYGVGFNDAAWVSGPAQLGYGEGDEATVIDFGGVPADKHITYYFRTTFEIADAAQVAELYVNLQRDDGAVVYLNGVEAFRDNMAPAPAVIGYQTLASGNVSGGAEDTLFEHVVNPARLVSGTNVIAVEVHQDAVDSSDVSFDLEVEVVIAGTPPVRRQPGDQPLYHIIMTDAERLSLADIGAGGGDEDSNAQMNATFISLDNEGVKVRDNTGVRNRGHGSRGRPPNNYHVNFRSDRKWNDVTGININSKFTYLQLQGNVVQRILGIEGGRAAGVQVRVNGANLASPGDTLFEMYGTYVAIEDLNSDFAANHFPDDNDGNVYKCFRTDGSDIRADLRYEGTNPNAYRDRYFKQTNEDEDDWSDLINLTDVLNNAPAATYFADVSQAIDVEQWAHYLATDSFWCNWETGLNRGYGDDFALYSGVLDPRFKLVPHDLDTLFGEGNSAGPIDYSIFGFRDGGGGGGGIVGFQRLLNDPDFVQRYYSAHLDGIEAVFNARAIRPIMQDTLGGWVDQSKIDDMVNWVDARRTAVLAQIPLTFSATSSLPINNGYHYTTLPTAPLNGTANAARTRSILVNGQYLTGWNPIVGGWAIGSGGGGPVLETIVTAGSTWAFLDNGTDQGTTWRDPGFDDSSWVTGPAQLGYGDGDEATVVDFGLDPNDKYVTTYFRHTFTVADASQYTGLTVRLMRDDGGAVYLNGTRVMLDRLLDPYDFSTGADGAAVGGGDESTFYERTVDPALLQDGPNTLAVEIHQMRSNGGVGPVTSSDISFDLELVGIKPGGGGPAAGGVPLAPGLNRLYVEAMSEMSGAGYVVDSGFVDVWYDTPGGSVPLENLRMITRDSYLPGVPFLVRCEALDSGGAIDRDVWDATVTLASSEPGITLDPPQVRMYNGLGTALVTATGSGGFTLVGASGGQTTTRTLSSLEGAPMTTVSGTLPGAATSWSGVVHVTGDLLVPTGHTLTIQPGALILIDGVASGTDGADIDVQGAVQSLGTAAQPVTFTAFDPSLEWGEIHHDGAAPSLYQYTHIHLGGNSPGGGHTGTGPIFRPANSTLTFDHVCMTDTVGKIMQSTGGSDLTFRFCHLARAIMGPEIDGTALLLEDSWITEMFGPDDDDGLYIHGQGAGQDCTLRRGVIADTDDDGLDTLGSTVTIEDYIIRDVFDKGNSVQGGQVNHYRSLLIDNGIGIESKATAVVNLDHCTISGNAIGMFSEDKTGSPAAINEYFVTNSIVWGNTLDLRTDYDPVDLHFDYSDVGDWERYDGLGGPLLASGTGWTTGAGNLATDPDFFDPVASDLHLQTGSPCIDTGDPAYPQLDPDGSRTDMGYFVYDSGWVPITGGGSISGTLTTDTVLTAGGGPWHVPGDLIVPVGVTLTVEAGASLFFYPGTRLIDYGRVVTAGTDYAPVWLTSLPGAGDWGGAQFIDTLEDNILSHTILEYGVTNNGMVGVENSNLTVDSCYFDHTDRRRIRSIDSSLIVRDSTFADIFGPGVPPTTNNLSEHLWGGGIPAGGHFIIQGNTFGTTKGHNDALDFDSGARPGPIPQILDNVFLGSGDDCLDMEGDAHIEGNTFMNCHKDIYNTDPGESNTISAGTGVFVVVRNTFQNIDHAAIIKDGAYMYFENNTVIDASLSALYFDLAGQTLSPGRGAYVDGAIFQNAPTIFEEVIPATELEVNRSVLPAALHGLGVGNTDADPLLYDPGYGDFSLMPGSPAIGAGPNLLDMGALVPAGASISGEPAAFTTLTTATLAIAGPGIWHYRYSLNGAPYSAETTVTIPIQLTNLPDDRYTVYVLGRNSAGAWQTEPTVSRSWIVSTIPAQQLVVSEVMYAPLGGGDFEYIELHNTSPHFPYDLTGHSFINGVTYNFQSGVTVPPNGYVLLVAGEPTGNFAAFRLRYGLDQAPVILGQFSGSLRNEGEQVTLQNGTGETIAAFEYDDARGWPLPADGAGHSLVPREGVVPTSHSLDYGGNWRFSAYIDGSPGRSNPVLAPSLVLNEVAAHTDYASPPYDSNDWIELYNVSGSPVNFTGWYLSDDKDDLRKWALPGAITLPPGGRITFDEVNDFHSPLTTGFGLSKDGEQVFLSYLPGGPANRVADFARFKGQENDVTLARYPDGAAWWYATLPTRDAPNTPPIEDLRITEFMFHPAVNPLDEYIEIHNPTAGAINLSNASGSWRIDGGSSFDFPSTASIPAGGYAIVVTFNPNDAAALTAFEGVYGALPAGTQVFGPLVNRLANGGERLALERPQDSDPAGSGVSWIIVDEEIYFDSAPWTTGADGTGLSLHRLALAQSGNDPANWVAAEPSPGGVSGQIFPPLVQNLPATNIDRTSATLNGELTATGGENPIVRFYWGDSDGGTQSFNWQYFQELGIRTAGPFSLDVGGLQPGATYHYRVYARNSAGYAWASQSMVFQTLPALVFHQLTVNAQNGAVTANPDQASYLEGAIVTLTAAPAPGYRFADWSGDVPAGFESSNPLILTMDADKTLTARFTIIEPEALATRPHWILY